MSWSVEIPACTVFGTKTACYHFPLLAHSQQYQTPSCGRCADTAPIMVPRTTDGASPLHVVLKDDASFDDTELLLHLQDSAGAHT
jgi:hypothetical protein